MLSATRLHLEDNSDTLSRHPSVLACAAAASSSSGGGTCPAWCGGARALAGATTLTLHSAIVQMLHSKIGGAGDGNKHRPYPSLRWSDCHCANCNPADTDWLFVHVEAPQDGGVMTEEDVLFIHGFISSSGFWVETVLPNVSPTARARWRLFAVDLLWFGRGGG